MSHEDTIAAIATAPGRGAIATVRVSGPAVPGVAERLGLAPLSPRRATLRLLRHPDDGRTVDRVLATRFASPASYTGEEMLELGCHGGELGPQLVLEAVLAAGARKAESGEFTRRALLNGKLDLVQAEAILDLVDATSPAMRAAALHQVERGLSDRIESLRRGLVELQAMLTYEIDFPEEEDGRVSGDDVRESCERVREGLAALAEEGRSGELLRQGALTVIAGRPNTGKSSLFNALLGTPRAIVSETPGTTRDAIEASISIDGYPYRLVDTAGLRNRPGRIERLGIEVAQRYLEEADIVLMCVEAGREPGEDERSFLEAAKRNGRVVLVVRTKVDLPSHGAGEASRAGFDDSTTAPNQAWVSAHTGEGMVGLRELLVEAAFGGIRRREVPLVTRARHRRALLGALREVEAFAKAWRAGVTAEIAATHLLEATTRLEEVLGVITHEDVLDALFAEFCVGK